MLCSRRRKRHLVGAVFVVAFAACSGTSTQPEDIRAVRVPNDHPAVALRIESATVPKFAEAAGETGVVFACSESGRPAVWGVCVMRAEGVVAVVPFGNFGDLEVLATGRNQADVNVPLSDDEIFGVVEPEGPVDLVIFANGEEVGRLEGGP